MIQKELEVILLSPLQLSVQSSALYSAPKNYFHKNTLTREVQCLQTSRVLYIPFYPPIPPILDT